jgi:hypothetical protein
MRIGKEEDQGKEFQVYHVLGRTCCIETCRLWQFLSRVEEAIMISRWGSPEEDWLAQARCYQRQFGLSVEVVQWHPVIPEAHP